MKTSAIRHQRYYAHLLHNGLFSSEIFLTSDAQKSSSLCQGKKKVPSLTKAIADLAISLSPDCLVFSSIEYKGTKYREGQYVVIDVNEEEFSLKLGKIYKCILHNEKEVHFIVRNFKAFLSIHSFYCVNEPGCLSIVAMNDVIDYYPLSEIKGFPKCLVLHHHISK